MGHVFRPVTRASLCSVVVKKLVILGSTGSIGTQALEVVAGLRGASRWSAWPPARAGSGQSNRRAGTACRRSRWPTRTPRSGRGKAWSGRVLAGEEGIRELIVASGADLVLNGIVGAAGLGLDRRRAHRGDRRGARQQGEPGGRRRAGDGAGRGDRRPPAAGRLRALGPAPADRRPSRRGRSSGWSSPPRAGPSAAATTSPASPSPTRSPTRPGRWGGGSRSTRRR